MLLLQNKLLASSVFGTMYQHLSFLQKSSSFPPPFFVISTQTNSEYYFSMCVQTDTASVLHETIEYIKFLHDQVGVSVAQLEP
jgi:hypothetical protein